MVEKRRFGGRFCGTLRSIGVFLEHTCIYNFVYVAARNFDAWRFSINEEKANPSISELYSMSETLSADADDGYSMTSAFMKRMILEAQGALAF